MADSGSGIVAVILAGGVGSRVGLGIPKQFLKVAGQPVLQHTLDVFEASDSVREIIVMMNPDWIEQTKAIVAKGAFTKVTRILPGGETRNETTKAALAVLADDDRVLFHDAVRPLIDDRIIRECAATLEEYSAVDVVIPSADTLVVVDDAGMITDIPNRARFRRGQTPQGFHVGVLRAAYVEADADPAFQATDDCSVVLKYAPGTPIATVAGSEYNMKVTEPIDLFLIDKLFQVASREATSHPERHESLRGKVAVIFGGSEGIGAALASALRTHGAVVEVFARGLNGVDVSDIDSVTGSLADVQHAHGRIDIVVNSAGILNVGLLHEQDYGDIATMVAVNYVGALNVARAAHEHLAATAGALLLFTSSSHTRGRASYSVYSSSKAAIVNLGQALADEWADDSIRVNVINPERTSTPMRTKAFGDEDPATLLTADAVAETCVDVLTATMTGQVVDVRVSTQP